MGEVNDYITINLWNQFENLPFQIYLPNTRSGYGVNSFPDGENYYKACLKWHLGIAISPEEIHEKGLEEVNRISGEMHKVIIVKLKL